MAKTKDFSGEPDETTALNNQEEGEQEQDGVETSRVAGAAIFGAIVGFALGGARLGIVAGLGAGAAATTQCAAGDVARSMGDTTIAVGNKVKEVDEKHNVLQNTKAAAGAAMNTTLDTLKKMDEKHKIVHQSKEAAKVAYQHAVEFENKHNIVENTAKKISEGANFVTKKLSEEKTQRS